jgi:exodeoxyribonuclease VII large subunit
MDTLFNEESTTVASPLKVSELVSLVKGSVERAHKNIRVVGEISSFKQWQSGHCYFDIKDEIALIPAVMFRPHFMRVPFEVKNGLEIICSGRISVYAAQARLQLIVESMEPLGQGALALAFLQLKEKLQKAGLFDNASKKTLKLLPTRIGIITSKDGAALRDMLRILKNRAPALSIMLKSVRVQGLFAKEEIALAIELLDKQNLDAIIVGRGGGSLEDLWAFNEEIVAHAIFKAKTPIISAVGHETDTTISDFVADIRAATPTHAAVLVTPVISEVYEHLGASKNTLYERLRMIINKSFLKLFEHKKLIKDPRVLLFRHWQRLDEYNKELTKLSRQLLKKERVRLLNQQQKLLSLAPLRKLRLKQQMLYDYKTRLERSIKALIILKRSVYENSVIKLEALSPLGVLTRGYALVKDADNHVISSVKNIYINQELIIRFHDGFFNAQVKDKEQL